MDSSEEEIAVLLNRGLYQAKPGRNTPSAGRYKRIINDVYDHENKKIKHVYQCSKCNKVLKYEAGNGTKPLNSHADRCDPQPKGKCLSIV